MDHPRRDFSLLPPEFYVGFHPLIFQSPQKLRDYFVVSSEKFAWQKITTKLTILFSRLVLQFLESPSFKFIPQPHQSLNNLFPSFVVSGSFVLNIDVADEPAMRAKESDGCGKAVFDLWEFDLPAIFHIQFLYNLYVFV